MNVLVSAKRSLYQNKEIVLLIHQSGREWEDGWLKQLIFAKGGI
jgi:hypothetical protein